ncbi:MAG: AmmeMemoRadiSam system radical SAM enzyme, partial [Crenarchaeota archaeon]|nr:AmmeMemoRadiSam system radical SAM enzyme [Thermoproteota archaeon]
RYVYIGNVPGHPLEHTYCPNCGKIVIKRYGFDILEVNLTEDNRCIYCGTKINIGGKIWPTWKLENRFRYIPIASLTRYVRIDISSIAKRS